MPQFSVLQKVSFNRWRGKWVGFALLVTFFFILTVFLGFWQLDRAQQKENLLVRAVSNDVLPISQWPSAVNGQLVNLTGNYLTQFQFLVDNKPFEGQAGYDLIVPFVENIGDERVVFWVNLGWKKASIDRDVFTQTALPTESLEVLARVYLPEKKAFRLSDKQFANSGWPKRVQYFAPDFFATSIGLDSTRLASGFELRLEEHQPGLQVRRWLPSLLMPPAKHLAYAVQWFLLAFALIVLVVVFLVRHFKEGVNNEI